MEGGLLLGIDLGCSAAKALLTGRDGRIVARALCFREEGTPARRLARLAEGLGPRVREVAAAVVVPDGGEEGARALRELATALTAAGVRAPLLVPGADGTPLPPERAVADPRALGNARLAALRLLARTSSMLPLFLADLGGGPARLLAVTGEGDVRVVDLPALAGDSVLAVEPGQGLVATDARAVPACRMARLRPETADLFARVAEAPDGDSVRLLYRPEGVEAELPPPLAAVFAKARLLPEGEVRGRVPPAELEAAFAAGHLLLVQATLTDATRLMGRTDLGDERAARFAVAALARVGGLAGEPPELLARRVLDAAEAELARDLVRLALARAGEAVDWLDAAARGPVFAAALEPGWRPPRPAPIEADFRLDWPLAATGGLAVLAERPAIRLDAQRLQAPEAPFSLALAALQLLDPPPPFPRWP